MVPGNINLKNVSLNLPRNSIIVFTGLSGSGKSSLAFDTIFAEGQRRYVESLSAYARQFLGQMDKPNVDFIEGLSPAVAIDQKSTSRNPRSTVGTITEVYDYLRLLYARVGIAHCPRCGLKISKQSAQQIVDQILELEAGQRFLVLAPIARGKKGEFHDQLRALQTQGFSRVRIDSIVYSLDDLPKLKKTEKHNIEVVIDRLTVDPKTRSRLNDSIEAALNLGSGTVLLHFVDWKPGTTHEETILFSEHLACPEDGISFDELEPRSFSFNSPFGACPECTGLGSRLEPDEELIIPNQDLSINDGAISIWSIGTTSEYFSRLLESVCLDVGIDMELPWRKLSTKARKVLLYGYEEPVNVKFKNRYGRRRSYDTQYEGVINFISRRHQESDSDAARDKMAGYMREVPCTACNGQRLKPISLAVTISGKSISELASLPVGAAYEFLSNLSLNKRDHAISERVLKEVNERLRFLIDVGLHYLTLDRSFGLLSRRRSAKNPAGNSNWIRFGWSSLCLGRAEYWSSSKR